MRESFMQRSAIFHVVLGAKAIHDDNFEGHIMILNDLLRLGARVDVQDTAGHTPIFYSISLVERFNATLFEVAKKLLEAGANPNIPDRFGNVPLAVCCAASGFDTEQNLKLLLKHGADPYIRNHSGNSPLSMSSNNPKIESLLTATLKKDVKPLTPDVNPPPTYRP